MLCGHNMQLTQLFDGPDSLLGYDATSATAPWMLRTTASLNNMQLQLRTPWAWCPATCAQERQQLKVQPACGSQVLCVTEHNIVNTAHTIPFCTHAMWRNCYMHNSCITSHPSTRHAAQLTPWNNFPASCPTQPFVWLAHFPLVHMLTMCPQEGAHTI